MKMRMAVSLVALAMAAPAFAQESYQAPRTADGKPDFQGFWTNVSLTSLERPGNFKSLVIPEADAKRILFGRTKGEKQKQEKERSAEVRKLDGAKRDKEGDKSRD